MARLSLYDRCDPRRPHLIHVTQGATGSCLCQVDGTKKRPTLDLRGVARISLRHNFELLAAVFVGSYFLCTFVFPLTPTWFGVPFMFVGVVPAFAACGYFCPWPYHQQKAIA